MDPMDNDEALMLTPCFNGVRFDLHDLWGPMNCYQSAQVEGTGDRFSRQVDEAGGSCLKASAVGKYLIKPIYITSWASVKKKHRLEHLENGQLKMLTYCCHIFRFFSPKNHPHCIIR